MDKLKKQIVINILIVVISVVVIFFAKSYQANGLLDWHKYLGSDIVFVMITALLTMVSWRYVETLKGNGIYNVIVLFIGIIFAIEYGLAIADCNDFLTTCISWSLLIFLIIYIVENKIIIDYYISIERNRSRDNLGYREEEK